MGNSSSEQADFGAGIYRGRKAPPNSVYDALNALVDDEGQLFRRGTSAVKSNADTAALDTLADSYTAAGRRTVFGSSSGATTWALSADDATPVQVGTGIRGFSRPAASTGVLFFPAGPANNFPVRAYGGSLKASVFQTGTAAVTAGSATVTGSGTSWLSTIDAGVIFSISGNGSTNVVRQVVSDTQLTLFKPFDGSTNAAASFAMFSTLGIGGSPFTGYGIAGSQGVYVTAVGTGQRLIIAVNQRAFVSDVNDPFSFGVNSYLEIPSGSVITGADSIQDSAFLWTTGGVWRLSNLDLDVIDDAGNIQWQQELINKDVLLWGDSGIAAWEGAFVVPALDDVYLLGADGTAASISQSIRPLYRSYVKAGYSPGVAAVHRGHYFLSIVNGTTQVDTLVCRLDRAPRPWTRWSGHAASTAFAQRVGDTARSPKLLGISGARVTDLTGCMDVTSSLQDADSTTPTFRVDENDIDTGPGIRPNTVEKVRYVYETTGGTPTISVSYATGPEGSSYSAATLKRGGGSSAGTDYSAWKVTKKAERLRLRFECTSQVTSLILRRREATIRQSAQN